MPRKTTKTTKPVKTEKEPIEITVTRDPSFKGLNLDIPSTHEFLNYVNSTGTILTSTIQNAYSSLDTLEHKLLILANESIQNTPRQKDIDAAKLEIENLKQSMAGLEDLKKNNAKIEDFLKQNIEFITTAIETKSRFNTVEGDIASLQKRLSHVEDQINKSRDRTITVVAAVISLLALLANVVMAVLSKP